MLLDGKGKNASRLVFVISVQNLYLYGVRYMRIENNILIAECTAYDFEALVDSRQSADETTTRKIYPEPGKFTQKIYPEPGKFTQKKVGKTAQSIIDAIVADSKITRKGLASLLGISENAVKYHLSTLQAREIILHIGPDKGGHWKVLVKK